MKSRADYIAGNCTFSDYYRQFITPRLSEAIREKIGLNALHRSKCEHLNDIPLSKWDALFQDSQIKNEMSHALKAHGDYLSLAGCVCVAKEAARQMLERKL